MRSYLISLICGILLAYSTVYSTRLDIPIKFQDTPKKYWCWAACCQMTLLFYGTDVSQSRIVEEIYVLDDVDTTLPLYNPVGAACRGLSLSLPSSEEAGTVTWLT